MPEQLAIVSVQLPARVLHQQFSAADDRAQWLLEIVRGDISELLQVGVGARQFGRGALEFFCRQLLFGDVPVGPDHMHRLAGGVPLDQGHRLDVMDGTIRPDDAELSVEFILLPKSRCHIFASTQQVVRMQGRFPRVIGAGKMRPRGAKHLEHLIIPVEAIVHRIKIPDADLRRLGGQEQPAGGGFQVLLCLQARGDVLMHHDQADGLSRLEARDPAAKPTMFGGRVARIFHGKLLRLASQHRSQAISKSPGLVASASGGIADG